MAEHLNAQHSAIKMLHSRVKLILVYIKAIENGTLPGNSEILSEAYALSQRLPVIQTSASKEEYNTVKREFEPLFWYQSMTFDISHFSFAAIQRCRFDHFLGHIKPKAVTISIIL